jgi:purine nucleoside phosphorylase
MSVIAVLGSAFSQPVLGGRELEAVPLKTEFGDTVFHKYLRGDGQLAYVLFRHGAPRKFLPHQIPYLANAVALRQLGCEALLLTSSVGVLDPQVPLAAPLSVVDLLMVDNRLPDGRTCTLFQQPYEKQAHLVIEQGLFSAELTEQVERIAEQLGVPSKGRVVFAYHGGPRTKTPTENAYFVRNGAHVNSMTLAPEAVLANEAGIPVAALVVGHKYSLATPPAAPVSVSASLEVAARCLEPIVLGFLEYGVPVPFRNQLYAP